MLQRLLTISRFMEHPAINGSVKRRQFISVHSLTRNRKSQAAGQDERAITLHGARIGYGVKEGKGPKFMDRSGAHYQIH